MDQIKEFYSGPSWVTIEEVALRMADDFNHIVEFVRDDLVPYRYHEDGVEIWWEGFQIVAPDLYDLAGDLEAINEAAEEVSEADLHTLLTEYTRRRDDRV